MLKPRPDLDRDVSEGESNSRSNRATSLFADDFHENPLPASAVEFVVENVFPRPEVQLAGGDRDDHLAPHHLPLQMSIGVVFARAIVTITTRRRIERRELLEPDFVVVMQARFVVVDKHRRRDVHRVDEHQAVLDAALGDEAFDFAMDRDDRSPLGDFHPQLLRESFHRGDLGQIRVQEANVWRTATVGQHSLGQHSLMDFQPARRRVNSVSASSHTREPIVTRGVL